MPYRGEIFAPGQYYHIYNRGAGRALIFFGEENYDYLERLMRRYCQGYGAAAIAFCLMPNHYHFLRRQETDRSLSDFINVLFNAYVQALNRRRGRSGTLFEGRFRHARVDRWDYLIHLCRYIHCNPVKADLVTLAEDWPHSNYREWVGLRDGALKDEQFIRDHFPTQGEYRDFVQDVEDEPRGREKIKQYVWD